MWLFIIALVIIFVVATTIIAGTQQKVTADRRADLSSRFATDELYVSAVDGSAIGINFNGKKVLLGKAGTDGSYDFSKLSAVELVENGATVSTTNRGSQLAGAAIGGLALGGVGAIIGGLSGSKTARSMLSSIVVKVTVDDRHHPVHTITFLNVSGRGVEPDGFVAKRARETAARVHAHLVNAMRQAQATSTALPAAAASAGQLQNLWEMRQAGALTYDEFEQQKQVLLAGQQTAMALAPPAKSGRRYRVILVHPGTTRRKFAAAMIAQVPEIMETKVIKLMQNLPAVILSNVSAERARSVQAALTEAGATVEIE